MMNTHENTEQLREMKPKTPLPVPDIFRPGTAKEMPRLRKAEHLKLENTVASSEPFSVVDQPEFRKPVSSLASTQITTFVRGLL